MSYWTQYSIVKTNDDDGRGDGGSDGDITPLSLHISAVLT